MILQTLPSDPIPVYANIPTVISTLTTPPGSWILFYYPDVSEVEFLTSDASLVTSMFQNTDFEKEVFRINSQFSYAYESTESKTWSTVQVVSNPRFVKAGVLRATQLS